VQNPKDITAISKGKRKFWKCKRSLFPPLYLLSTTKPPTYLEKQAAATASETTFTHDGNAVTKKISFIHVMGGEDNSTASFKPLQQFPNTSPRLWV
jgi:hypothetical protein